MILDWTRRLASALSPKGAAATVTSGSFIVWEPCTHSHAEVVPGFVKYLLDLGYPVSVFMTPQRHDEGLFSRFHDPRITLHRLSQSEIVRHFRRNCLGKACGILITTARKFGGGSTYAEELALFAGRAPGQKVLLVEHDVREPFDSGALHSDIITLKRVHYRNAATTAVNPHYFGKIVAGTKNGGPVNFITVGALRGKRRNTDALLAAIQQLHDRGIANFRITVIGRGSLSRIPRCIQSYFEILGRADFFELYSRLEKSCYFLPLLDPDNAAHDRYITTGTSGNFQLILGFRKPCLVAAKFAAANGFDSRNSIIYAGNAQLADAMAHAISLSAAGYAALQESLGRLADTVYTESLRNLGELIGERCSPATHLAD